MEQSPFFRTNLSGQKIGVSWPEIREIRRDILDYFDDNLNEDLNVLAHTQRPLNTFAKYLSIGFTEEFSESERYVWLCERGCLALLNAMVLDFLSDQVFEGSETWNQAKEAAQFSLQYLIQYKPTEPILEIGKNFLIASCKFIDEATGQDISETGEALFAIKDQGAWFTKHIVGDYFKTTARLDFG